MSGLAQILERRARDPGVVGIHPRRFRHTYVHSWLVDGGQETDLMRLAGQENDLMRLAGWRTRQMVGRYAASVADSQAHGAYRKAALREPL